ncbi:MAG: hypothetical protein ABSD20_05335 [Terriglobales bacterium]|jgi:hypothetical protein
MIPQAEVKPATRRQSTRSQRGSFARYERALGILCIFPPACAGGYILPRLPALDRGADMTGACRKVL